MMHAAWNRTARSTILLVALALVAGAPVVQATIPDADIRDGVNRGGFGMFEGAYGQADFALSGRSAVGGYIGVDPNDIYYSDYSHGDDTFDEDLLVGGHYMYQFLEGTTEG